HARTPTGGDMAERGRRSAVSRKRRRVDYRQLMQGLYWNKAYRKDYLFYSRTSIWDEDLAARDRRYKILERMKASGLEIPIDPDEIPSVLERLKTNGYSKCDFLPAVQVKSLQRKEDGKFGFLRDQRFLCVEIDIRADRKSIDANLWNLVVDCRHHVKYRHEILQKQFCPEQWEVYAAVKQRGERLLDLARRKSGEKGNPSYNPFLRSEDKRLRELFKKAQRAVTSVYPPQ